MKDTMVEQFKKHANDTGSVEIQVAQLLEDIQRLTEHCKQNPKDFSSKRGLLMMVNRRRKFLKYLQRVNQKAYNQLMK